MLTGIHFLATYACNFECDHCFLHCGPAAGGTFTIRQIRDILDEAVRIGTVETICFEGGEPLLYYPLILAGIEQARRRGFRCSIVTNAYWATSPEDAALWLRPLAQLGVTEISISDDPLHYGEAPGAHAERISQAAGKLGMTVRNLQTDRPTVQPASDADSGADGPTIAGGVMFRGRAAEKLTADLPTRPWQALDSCPHEKLAEPGRVHVDCFGHVHLCQGLSMGNLWQVPLSQLVAGYDPQAHPVVGPLIRGGPAQLAEEYHVPHQPEYVDECHFCYQVRRALLERFSRYLAPRQAYGLE